jgi:hypothetical protein
MFGLKKKNPDADKLTVQVHVVGNAEVFNLAQKIWSENQRTLRADPATGKEFLHFAYANPKCVVWLQRDHGRQQLFELVVHWENESNMHEVFVVLNTPQPEGDGTRAKQLLDSVLSMPSIVLSNGNS